MLGVLVCGYGVVPVPAASTLAHGMSRDVLVDVDPGMVELSIVIAYTSCGLGGLGVHRKGRWGDLGLESDVSERSRVAAM